jgi:serine/threonine-protein kinase
VPSDDDPRDLGRVGTTLNDKWTLERLLGVGGMGAVYAARHRNGAVAAVKLLHPDLARNKVVRERFRREGYAANKVGHAGVVKVLDDDVVASGPDDGAAFLVMELLDGESLADRMERGQAIGERELLEMADSVLDVLHAAHRNGVIHRDLKPENLFFAREDGGKTRVKVLDFGLARLLDEQAITAYGLVLGTPSFMSPEQASGKTNEVDGRTDLFALAATGFRVRSGRRVHDGDDPIELVKKMSTLPAPPLRSVAPDVSPAFARVIDKGLQFKREDRYPSAAAMQKDVRRALKELSSRKPPPPPRAKGREEPTIELSDRDIVRPPARGMDESVRIPMKRSVLVWLFFFVLVAAGVKAYLVYRPLDAYLHPSAAPSSSADEVPSVAPAASAPAHPPPDAGPPHRPRPAGSHLAKPAKP